MVGAWLTRCVLHIIIAIDHCILHSHYFGVKKCLAQRFCVPIRKYVPISIGRILRCYTQNFSSTIIILGMILRSYTQKCSYINRNDFAYNNAKLFLYNYMGVILRIATQHLSYIWESMAVYPYAI